MTDKIIIEVNFSEGLALRTGMADSQRDIQRSLDRAISDQANNVPLVIDEFTYPKQIEYFTGRLNVVTELYERIDKLLDIALDTPWTE